MPKNRRGRPATGKDPQVVLRMPDTLIGAIDTWGEANSIGRSEAIRRLVEQGLTVMTKTKQPLQVRAHRAKELATSTIEKIIDPGVPTEVKAERRRRLTKGPSEFRENRVDLPKTKGRPK